MRWDSASPAAEDRMLFDDGDCSDTKSSFATNLESRSSARGEEKDIRFSFFIDRMIRCAITKGRAWMGRGAVRRDMEGMRRAAGGGPVAEREGLLLTPTGWISSIGDFFFPSHHVCGRVCELVHK
uniref:Uncharacterized protein LOC105038068 isoform X2 n=1 Tax=Elaeis guineensis var. tenera TaxID=51953 RepID=A0A6I9QMU0_ELAGV|nr:uncharacterized protein LOC105038068 isoform X2 [Elaeis guineensis]